MSPEAVDLAIEARWIAPMTPARLLERHSLIVRHGRIVDVLPVALARERYAPLTRLERSTHLLMPGLVDARVRLDAAPGPGRSFADGILLGIARLLRSGITCFAHVGARAAEVAQLALEQGLRVCLAPSLAPGEAFAASLRETLRLHDEYRRHPSVATAFAIDDLNALDEAMIARIATLSDEIDMSVLAALHASEREIEDSVRRYGARPLARLERHGLLSPALVAAHMGYLDAQEIALARRCGIGITLCPESDIAGAIASAPLWTDAAVRVSLGRAAGSEDPGLFADIRLLARLAAGRLGPAEVLAAATRGGAAALGFEGVAGTLELGRAADLLCLDLGIPAAHGTDAPLATVVASGGRDLVCDVWVAGRQLICEGELLRLDWPRLAARLDRPEDLDE